MATKIRKTPCNEVKIGFREPNMRTIYCRCCGEWEMVNGRIVRYIERTW